MAKVMDDVAVIRGMSTGEGGHYRAKYLLHTGYERLGGFEHPSIGSIVSSCRCVTRTATCRITCNR